MIDFSKRLLSSFNVSLPTGLMLETCFTPTQDRYDPERDIPSGFISDHYSMYMVNVLTLLRNITNSLDLPAETILKDKGIWNVLADEIDIINNLFLSLNKGITVIFYYPHVLKLQEHFNRGKPRTFTKKMENIKMLYEAISKVKLKELEFIDIKLLKDVTVFPRSIKSLINKKKCLITTHTPTDLLNHSRDFPMVLLESHTGVLKGEDKFFTKYVKIGNNNMEIFPFREILIYFLGDGIVSSITSIKARNDLLRYSKEWDKRITEAGIATYIKKDPRTKKYLSTYGSLYSRQV